MEEEESSSKVHSEEEKVLPDKNKKRKLKTPSQVEALEKFYNEHKYPLESMKLELAEKIGLTEKQVSGWFCHRRLKDKKLSRDEACENGRLDRSSGVIQDHGSGLGQDSCGSTKPGDYRHVDPREADSLQLCGQDIPAADLAYGKRSHYTGNLSGMDDTSSDSSSALQDIFISQGVNPSDIESSRYLTQNGAIIPINENCTNNRVSTRPSGYLKLKGNSEHAAITAVKRQLGRHYQQDGPPLGIEFEPLPPGAFETPVREPDNEPYGVNDPIMPHPPEISGVRKQHVVGTKYDVYNSKIGSQDSFMEHENIRTLHGPNSPENYSHRQSKHKSSFPNYYSKHLSGRNPSFNTSEGSAGKTAFHNTDRSIAMRSKHGGDEMRLNSVSKPQLPIYNDKITNEQTEPYLHKYDDVKPKNVKRREFLSSKPSSSLLWKGESLDMAGDDSSRRRAKDEKLYGSRSGSREYQKPARVKMNPTNDLMDLSKKVRDEYPQEEYVSKLSYSETPSWTKQIKRSVGEMPSSFSEDETAETSSSIE